MLIILPRINQYDVGSWAELISDYEHDILLVHNIVLTDNRMAEEKEEMHVCKAVDFLSCFQFSQARKHLQSNGLGNHTDPAIADQISWKHPAWKAPITTWSNNELLVSRKGIDRDIFFLESWALKADVAPGLGCLRNEHLLALAINPSC